MNFKIGSFERQMTTSRQPGSRSSFAGGVCVWLLAVGSVCALAQQPAAPTPGQLPTSQKATEARYALLPGDIIDLAYRFTPDLNQTVTIQPDGYVNLNLIGSLKVGGLTVDEAHDLIVKKASVHLNEPELNLTLKEFQQSSVVVAGEVAKPGKFPVRPGMTVLQAVLLSGGFTENAKAGQIILFRRVDTENAEVHLLKLDKLKHTVDLHHDMKLEPGDMILVPRDNISIIARYIKLAQVGFYFNPLSNIP